LAEGQTRLKVESDQVKTG